MPGRSANQLWLLAAMCALGTFRVCEARQAWPARLPVAVNRRRQWPAQLSWISQRALQAAPPLPRL
eukprot:5073429-Prymnesium_polylepis.1